VNAKTALLSAALLLLAPTAIAAAANTDAACNEFPTDDVNLRTGQVTGSGPAAFLNDGPGCPGPAAACRSKFAARLGATVLLGKSRGDYVCAFDGRSGATGWLPQQRVAARAIEAAPPLAAWVGTWVLYDDRIVLKQAGDSIEAAGEAYWPGKNIMPANEGEFGGTAKPSGNRLHFGEEECTIDLALAGPFLVVADNKECGGHNVSFTGIYTRRSRAAR
jgi:hypothetical protein